MILNTICEHNIHQKLPRWSGIGGSGGGDGGSAGFDSRWDDSIFSSDVSGVASESEFVMFYQINLIQQQNIELPVCIDCWEFCGSRACTNGMWRLKMSMHSFISTFFSVSVFSHIVCSSMNIMIFVGCPIMKSPHFRQLYKAWRWVDAIFVWFQV